MKAVGLLVVLVGAFIIHFQKVDAGRCIDVTSKGTDYTGTVSKTKTGVDCKMWTAQSKYTDFANDGGMANAKNYCRNPSGSDNSPWCYAGSSWDYCDIPFCQHDCMEVDSLGAEYTGTMSITTTGLTCLPWTNQQKYTDFRTDGGMDNAKNYCRNTGSSGSRPWCYTKSSWDYCDVPYCKHNCMVTDKGKEYTGTRSYSSDRHDCQSWASQTPNAHSYNTNAHFVADGGIANAKNYCRNPSGDPQPWCYTTKPGVRWQYCTIPKCGSSGEEQISFTLVVDDVINGVFADGAKIDGKITNNLVNVGSFSIPGSTSQISIQGKNLPGKCGVYGSDASGKFSTDSTWRCSNTYTAGWSEPNFDDSAWETAPATGRSSDNSWVIDVLGSLTVHPSAKFIWTSNCRTNQDVYCRSPRK